jgi:hypothetical protein
MKNGDLSINSNIIQIVYVEFSMVWNAERYAGLSAVSAIRTVAPP